MLSGHLGTQTFLNGVAAYLKSHAYGNATTNDLWAALSEASGQNITQLMVSFSELLFLKVKSFKIERSSGYEDSPYVRSCIWQNGDCQCINYCENWIARFRRPHSFVEHACL